MVALHSFQVGGLRQVKPFDPHTNRLTRGKEGVITDRDDAAFEGREDYL